MSPQQVVHFLSPSTHCPTGSIHNFFFCFFFFIVIIFFFVIFFFTITIFFSYLIIFFFHQSLLQVSVSERRPV